MLSYLPSFKWCQLQHYLFAFELRIEGLSIRIHTILERLLSWEKTAKGTIQFLKLLNMADLVTKQLEDLCNFCHISTCKGVCDSCFMNLTPVEKIKKEDKQLEIEEEVTIFYPCFFCKDKTTKGVCDKCSLYIIPAENIKKEVEEEIENDSSAPQGFSSIKTFEGPVVFSEPASEEEVINLDKLLKDMENKDDNLACFICTKIKNTCYDCSTKLIFHDESFEPMEESASEELKIFEFDSFSFFDVEDIEMEVYVLQQSGRWNIIEWQC